MSNKVELQTMKITSVDNNGKDGDVSYGFIIRDEFHCDTFECYPTFDELKKDISPENLLTTLYTGANYDIYYALKKTIDYRKGIYINGEFVPLEKLSEVIED